MFPTSIFKTRRSYHFMRYSNIGGIGRRGIRNCSSTLRRSNNREKRLRYSIEDGDGIGRVSMWTA
jgi:hypothetical protein